MKSCTTLSWILICISCIANANANKATTQESDPDPDQSATYYATKPYLSVTAPNRKPRNFSRQEFLASPLLKKLKVKADPAYKNQSRTYTVVPVSMLFSDLTLKSDTTIVFTCLDGFSAPISTERILNTDPSKAIAYIAFEMPSDPWPLIKNRSNKSTGPYYLVWENPEKSKITQEEWPFQLSGFVVKGTLAEQFPHIMPAAGLAETDVVMKGFKSFTKNCFACHSLNGEGMAHMGPDLNIPYSPTEYLKPEFLEILIRKPSNLRSWSEAKMSSFSKETLPDDELKAIIAYLQYMAKHKP